jgi:hypothetical protein
LAAYSRSSIISTRETLDSADKNAYGGGGVCAAKRARVIRGNGSADNIRAGGFYLREKGRRHDRTRDQRNKSKDPLTAGAIQTWISNRVFKSCDDIVDHCREAWNKLIDQPWRIMSIGMRDWARRS